MVYNKHYGNRARKHKKTNAKTTPQSALLFAHAEQETPPSAYLGGFFDHRHGHRVANGVSIEPRRPVRSTGE